MADVPVGTLLSGGVDSSLVTAIAAKFAGQIQTFSVETEDPQLDESQFSRAVAERCDTRHHELKVRGDIRKSLCRLIAAMGEPLADASAANTFAIAEQARQFVTVVLTGDGGDEGFGGYRQYLAYYFAGHLSRLGSGLLKLPLWALNRIRLNGTSPLHSARTVCRLASAPLEETLFSTSMAMDEATREFLYTPEFKDRLRQRHPREHYLRVLPLGDNALAVDRVMETKLLTVLPDDYLTKVDNATMAVSLEARSPFLDLDIVEMGMHIPAAARFRGGKSKSLLCCLAERYVPAKCVRRRKQGFVAPIGKWIRTDWPDLVEQMILGPQVERRAGTHLPFATNTVIVIASQFSAVWFYVGDMGRNCDNIGPQGARGGTGRISRAWVRTAINQPRFADSQHLFCEQGGPFASSNSRTFAP